MYKWDRLRVIPGDGLTNNDLLLCSFPVFLRLGIIAALNSSSPCTGGVIQSLKPFTAAVSTISKTQSYLSNRECEGGA